MINPHRRILKLCYIAQIEHLTDVLGWKLSSVVFYRWFRARNTTGLSFQPNIITFRFELIQSNSSLVMGSMEPGTSRAINTQISITICLIDYDAFRTKRQQLQKQTSQNDECAKFGR